MKIIKPWIFSLILVCGMGTVMVSCGDSKSTTVLPEPEPTPIDHNPQPEVVTPGKGYIEQAGLPDATLFLPAYPKQSDVDFIDDKLQWEWGKTQRSTARGTEARKHLRRSPDAVRIIMAQALGLDTISDTTTPALAKLLVNTYWTGWHSAATAKAGYLRPRPFVEMGEQPWIAADQADATGSFTSATTAAAWATAIIFAEMWPPLQNEILRQGYLFGEDRVISGSNYQSDVNGGYLCGAAAAAQMHGNYLMKYDFKNARAEYIKLKGYNESYNPDEEAEDPVGAEILNPPVTTDSYRYEADLKRYEYAKTFRGTPRGDQAIADANTSFEHLSEVYGEALGITVSQSETPHIYKLFEMIYPRSVEVANQLKWTYFRARPYVELEETTPVPDDEDYERGSSSFASGHTCLSWSIALMLAEAVPSRQNEILRRAYDFGYNRQIVGYHWATDIEAGRLLACTLVAHLHAEEAFTRQIILARVDYQKAAGL